MSLIRLSRIWTNTEFGWAIEKSGVGTGADQEKYSLASTSIFSMIGTHLGIRF